MSREKKPNLLLVEGQDDLNTIIHLLKRHGFDWDSPPGSEIGVVEKGGFRPLLDSIETEVKARPMKGNLGIVVDAEYSLEDRWKAITGRLSFLNFGIPITVSPDGLILNRPDRHSRLGVWIMPDNSLPGSLEHFLEKLIPIGDVLWPYAQETTQEAENRGAPFRREKSTICRKKAEIHTWLAWQEEPGQPFGTAVTANTFGHDSPEALAFVKWFRRLFLE